MSTSKLAFDPRRRYKYYISTKGKDIEDLSAVTGGVVPDFSVLLSRQRLSIPDTERGKCIIGITSNSFCASFDSKFTTAPNDTPSCK